MSILPIFIPHAGCPHQCVFCNQKKISGQHSAALASAKEQLARWRSWLRPSLAHEAAFYGGSFTGLPTELQEELLALTDALLAEGFIGSVRLSTRPDYIDEERLQLLRSHGVRLVELGVQSLDDRVLAAAERGHTAAQVAPAALLKRFGFQVGLQLMVGMPEQSFAGVQETVRKAIEMHPDVARIYPLLVIKGTPLAADYAAGRFVPLTLEKAVTQAAWAYRELTEAGVNVIRIGLQPDEELCAPGNILAGPFHPAMGEMVKSRVLRTEVTSQLEKLADCGAVTIYCPARLESKLRGQKSCNLRYWEACFPGLELQIIQDKADEIRVCPHVNPSHQL
jgi:histone acetyltransferase (RNA polymerase elongator complex component)